MGVSYLLLKLDKNYPPLPLVTHPLPLPVRFFPFFPTSRVMTPLRLAPRADLLFRRGQGGRAAHPLPPSLHSGEPSMAGSGRSGPARPPAPSAPPIDVLPPIACHGGPRGSMFGLRRMQNSTVNARDSRFILVQALDRRSSNDPTSSRRLPFALD